MRMGEREPLSFRSRRLVLGLMSRLVEGGGPVLEGELLRLHVGVSAETVGKVLGELVRFGAVHGSPPGGGGRRFVVTPLGLAWMERRVGPWPWPYDEVDDD